jgi:hypothetical protein
MTALADTHIERPVATVMSRAQNCFVAATVSEAPRVPGNPGLAGANAS